MDQMRVVAGVDGGGTRTRAALVDESGRVLGLGEAGPSNYGDVGLAGTQESIRLALSRAGCEPQPGRGPQPLAGAFLGLGNVVSPADRATIRHLVCELGLAPADHVLVDHDIRIALAGGLAGRPGIVLIVGTGSACYGRRADGRSWRAGGWSYLLDDAGSGYFLGLQAMIATVRAADGRGAPTLVADRVLQRLGLSEADEIMRRLYHDGLSRAEIAALAPLTIDAAEQRDAVAAEIIKRGADELSLMVATVARRLEFGLDPVMVTVTGGLATAGAAYVAPLQAAIRRRLPAVELVEPALPPVLGAALLALEDIGIPASPPLVAQLRAQRDRCC